MPECQTCTLEAKKLHPSGNCHLCETFSVPDQTKRMPNVAFQFEERVEEQVSCRLCGATQFEVGKGSYYTAIRCVKCGWERCIHEG